ncbi:MAG: glycoside hydrolase family 11 protein [Chitinispirillia bacterium]|nr:glycoside hydrolase family 11 protein [Chitinispirillia bacterium]MCL2242576.1 glycoside hydrolase family 11 protein [Chitinispirillia bacterium]
MNRITKALCMAVVGCSLAWAQGPTWTTSTIQAYNGYDYELWNQNNAGTVSMKLTGDNGTVANAKGGTFEATWSNTQNVLFRSGKKWGSSSTTTVSSIGNAVIEFAATWSSTDNVKMLGVYGWAYYPSGSVPTKQENGTNATFSDQIEYYIIQDRGSYNPASSGTNAKKYGSATIDGIAYDFYVCDRINQPMLTGNGNFKQYFSVPQSTGSHRTSGTITVSKHFEEWHKVNMIMTTCRLYEIAMKVESYTGSGSSNGNAMVTKNLLTIGGTVNPNNFTLDATASPAAGGTVTKNPNAASYAPNTNVQVTAVAQSGWEFTGWSGNATGTNATVTVNMNANKTVVATFAPLPGNTTNLIKDGNFPGTALTTNWTLNQGQYYGNSAATANVSGGQATINITSVGANPWEPQLVQQALALDEGLNYTLTFDAFAASPRIIDVQFQRPDSPWTTYSSKEFNLTAAKQTFTHSFKMGHASNTNSQFAISLGQSTANVMLSNISLVYGEATGICPQSRVALTGKNAPSLRVTARQGSAVNINFKASGSGETTVRLFSLKGDILSTARMQTVTGGSYAHTFNTARLPAGFYLVELRNNGKIEQARIALPK